MSDEKKVTAFIISSFRDAGTEQEFEAGSTVPVTEGAFKNYEAAGLVRKPNAEDKKAGDTAGKAA